jgi:xylan 1,4-beta-xylosidase
LLDVSSRLVPISKFNHDSFEHHADTEKQARDPFVSLRMRRNEDFSSRHGVAILACILLMSGGRARAQQITVNIEVKADHATGPFHPIWNFYGYDEPNYTYSPNGEKLLGELADSSPLPIHIRAHNLFTSGDGSASLKWGSTNVYSEDANGKAIYDWTIVDRIFDTYRAAHIKPLVELGFMPQALSANPQPYRHNFPHGSIFTGWAYPPKDYQKWGDLVFHFVAHLQDRYGAREAASWMWEVWNEPDIPYWKGTPEEYFKLYDYAADAVLRALPQAQVGGPDSTGPGNEKAAEFLRQFLEHCARQRNYATGKTGAPLHFISFHPKGAPTIEDGHIRMGVQRELAAIDRGFGIVASFPEWRNTPIVLGESDPEGCAACSPQDHPEDGYRNRPLYGAYTTEVLSQIYALSVQEHVNFRGAVTWAFEFEDQAYFPGFRALANHGIDMPVLNAFRMWGMLHGDRLAASSTGAVTTNQILRAGVRGAAAVDVIATRHGQQISVLVWNYSDDDLPVPAAPIALAISGIPAAAKKALVEHFRVDDLHSDAYTEWESIGSPSHPSSDQQARLEEAGQLHQLASPRWIAITGGQVQLNFTLPREGLSLIRLAW